MLQSLMLRKVVRGRVPNHGQSTEQIAVALPPMHHVAQVVFDDGRASISRKSCECGSNADFTFEMCICGCENFGCPCVIPGHWLDHCGIYEQSINKLARLYSRTAIRIDPKWIYENVP